VSKKSRNDRDPQTGSRSFGRPGHSELVKGLSHPLRVEILTVLTQRVASPKLLSQTLDRSLTNVSYHVRVLDKLGLVELVEEERVRGAVAHYYKAVDRPLLSNADWERLPNEVRKAVSAYGMDAIISDAAGALDDGTFDSRADRHLSRTPLLLDSQGFARLSAVFDEALEVILDEQAASAARMIKSKETPIHTIAAMALFCVPEPK
jgi:DNA-binding transcriptional ArsR family regulator